MDEELDQLHEKISTLSKALATVTEEKSKMAAAFQADKKLAIVSCPLLIIHKNVVDRFHKFFMESQIKHVGNPTNMDPSGTIGFMQYNEIHYMIFIRDLA